jgi:hypothetical protein
MESSCQWFGSVAGEASHLIEHEDGEEEAHENCIDTEQKSKS